MATVITRTWRGRGPSGRPLRKTSYGYTLQIDGRQVRVVNASWTKAEAEAALAERILVKEAPAATPPSTPLTLAQAAERYVLAKARKRSLAQDERILTHLLTHFGPATPLTDLDSAKIAHYRDTRMGRPEQRRDRRQGALSPATINRELALLSHLFTLAATEWNVLAAAPKIRRLREPEGRIRWLEPPEEARLLAACRQSRNPWLLGITILALETGMRKGELLGLVWDRVDFSRGVIQLELTKNGTRREIPMRQAVYTVLAELPGTHQGRVWPGGIRHAFVAALLRARIEGFRFHDCRHHFASWFMMRGGSLQALKEILGHRDLRMTLRYAHLSPNYLRGEMLKTEVTAPGQAADSAHAQRIASETGMVTQAEVVGGEPSR